MCRGTRQGWYGMGRGNNPLVLQRIEASVKWIKRYWIRGAEKPGEFQIRPSRFRDCHVGAGDKGAESTDLDILARVLHVGAAQATQKEG